MIILRENTQGPYNKLMCFPLLKCIGYFSPSYGAEIRLPHTERAFFFLESDQCRHEKQSDVIVLVIGEEFCVAP